MCIHLIPSGSSRTASPFYPFFSYSSFQFKGRQAICDLSISFEKPAEKLLIKTTNITTQPSSFGAIMSHYLKDPVEEEKAELPELPPL